MAFEPRRERYSDRDEAFEYYDVLQKVTGHLRAPRSRFRHRIMELS
jgi:hypothetical protein